MKRFQRLFTLCMVALLLQSCGFVDQNEKPQAQSGIPEQDAQSDVSFTLLHSPREGSAKIGYAENGLYYLQYIQDGTGDLQLIYLDYASAQEHVLCASPECLHNNEACTGWFPGNYGPGSTMVVNGSVYICFSGSNPEVGTVVFPQIVAMDADGRNRTQLTTLSESSVLKGSFATDGTSLYVTEKAFEIEGETYQTKTKLMKIDLSTGAQTYLQTWDADIWITGAHQQYMFLLKPENFDTNGFSIYEGAHGAAYTILGMDAQGNETTLHSVVEDGFLGTVRGDSYYTLTIKNSALTRTNLFTGETVTLCTLPNALEKGKAFFGDLVGNQLFIQGALATRPSETEIATLYGVDVNNGTCTEINLTQEDPNLPETDNPILVVAQWQDKYVVKNRMMLRRISYVDDTGVKQIMEVMSMGYAMISKDDFLSSTPNYRNVKPPV